MESAKTKVIIPIDGWGFDTQELWIRIGQVSFRIPYKYEGPILAPELSVEVTLAQLSQPPVE